MNKLINTLRNIWSFEKLKNKIVVTLLFTLFYFWGTHIMLPGIDPNKLDLLSGKDGLLGLFDILSGGSFYNASIFALGIMPYITALILMQLIVIMIPEVLKLQKEGDNGRKKIMKWTKYITIGVTVFQAAAYATYLQVVNRDALINSYSEYFWISSVIILTAGTLFLMWLVEKIQDKVLGNGTLIFERLN